MEKIAKILSAGLASAVSMYGLYCAYRNEVEREKRLEDEKLYYELAVNNNSLHAIAVANLREVNEGIAKINDKIDAIAREAITETRH